MNDPIATAAYLQQMLADVNCSRARVRRADYSIRRGIAASLASNEPDALAYARRETEGLAQAYAQAASACDPAVRRFYERRAAQYAAASRIADVRERAVNGLTAADARILLDARESGGQRCRWVDEARLRALMPYIDESRLPAIPERIAVLHVLETTSMGADRLKQEVETRLGEPMTSRFAWEWDLERLAEDGLVHYDDGHYAITERGRIAASLHEGGCVSVRLESLGQD